MNYWLYAIPISAILSYSFYLIHPYAGIAMLVFCGYVTGKENKDA